MSVIGMMSACKISLAHINEPHHSKAKSQSTVLTLVIDSPWGVLMQQDQIEEFLESQRLNQQEWSIYLVPNQPVIHLVTIPDNVPHEVQVGFLCRDKFASVTEAIEWLCHDHESPVLRYLANQK